MSRGQVNQGRALRDIRHVLEGLAECAGQVPALDSVSYPGLPSKLSVFLYKEKPTDEVYAQRAKHAEHTKCLGAQSMHIVQYEGTFYFVESHLLLCALQTTCRSGVHSRDLAASQGRPTSLVSTMCYVIVKHVTSVYGCAEQTTETRRLILHVPNST